MGRYSVKYFLSIDCGLTKSKAVLFERTGKMLFESQLDTPRKSNQINTAALHKTVVTLINDILKSTGIDPEDILTVSTSGHGNGIYFIGENGILPFGFSSMYTESKKYTPPTDATFPITLQSSWSGQPLAILSHIKHEKPELFAKIRKILFCKDLIKYILTERICTDYTDASAAGLLNCKTAQYDEKLLKIYDLDGHADILPDLCRCTDTIGTVSEKFAKVSGLSVKTQVVGGLFDVNSCMLGAGITSPGKYCIIAGTWGINSAIVEAPISCKEITQCCNFSYPEEYMCIDSAPTSCTNLEWFTKNILRDISYRQADEIVEHQQGDPTLLYLPYIFTPMDINISGSFVGLKAEHTYKDMLRAVFEGIVFDHAYRLEKLKRAGIVYDSAVLTGGAANSSVFCHMFADCTGLEIYTTTQSQTGALGGAIIGSVAAGLYKDVAEAANAMVQVQRCYKPKTTDYYRQKFELFKETVNKLRNIQ